MTGDGLPKHDLDYRYGVYKPAHPGCELLKYFPNDGLTYRVPVGGKTIVNVFYDHGGEEVHHIHRGPYRYDRVWNLVHVCKWVHDFCTNFEHPGQIVATYHKIQAGEHDEAAAHKCFGFYPLGKVLTYDPEFPWVAKLQKRIERKWRAA